MENKTIKQTANNVMWVEYWIRKAHPSFEDYMLLAERYDEYRWICEIKLPLINKTVKSISEKEVNAMMNAADKAAKLIDRYMKEHPELKIRNKFKNNHWEIESDETGRFLSLKMNSDWKRKNDLKMEKMMNDSFETIKKAIRKIAIINGSSKNLFIQVMDQSLFDENMTVKDILEEASDRVRKEYNATFSTSYFDKDVDSVIVMGYAPHLSRKEN